jgi:hypothetical protein
MNARKIAYVPALRALFAMPASYDPSKITRDDATNDSAICGAAEELTALRRASKKTSSMARETVDDVTDAELSELAAIDEEWADAIRSCHEGNVEDMRGHLGRAQEFAARWGSSQHEDAALALLPTD